MGFVIDGHEIGIRNIRTGSCAVIIGPKKYSTEPKAKASACYFKVPFCSRTCQFAPIYCSLKSNTTILLQLLHQISSLTLFRPRLVSTQHYLASVSETSTSLSEDSKSECQHGRWVVAQFLVTALTRLESQYDFPLLKPRSLFSATPFYSTIP